MTIYIASDHAGFELKKQIIAQLISHTAIDVGTFTNESVDYPVYAHKLCEKMKQNKSSCGILICGSGLGMSMVANRYSHIRAALCHCPEFAKLSREHNNANIIVLPARFTTLDNAMESLKYFLETEFEGGRHQRRVDLFL